MIAVGSRRGDVNLVFKTIQDTVWRDTSYQWPILGYPETVGGFSSQDIHDYVNAHYQPQSMLLVVVGNVNADEVLAEAALLGARGFRHLLLVSGEHPRHVSVEYMEGLLRALAPSFPSLSVPSQGLE